MRRTAALLALAFALAPAGCAESGPRDRSLLARGTLARAEADAAAADGGETDEANGLVPDPLSIYYSEDAELVVRFEPAATLERLWAAEWRRLRETVPAFAPVELDVAAAVRRLLGLPDAVRFDLVRPFALVKRPGGWVGILPSRSREEAGPRLKPLDAVYAVAGDPGLVDGYEAGFTKGVRFPGHIAVLGSPAAVAALGGKLAPLARRFGLDTAPLDRFLPEPPTDVVRVDLAAGFEDDAVRLDLRLGLRERSPTAAALAKLAPAAAAPDRGAAELVLELTDAPLRLEGLLLGLWHGRSRRLTAAWRARFDLARPLLAALGENARLTLDLDAGGARTATLLATLSDPDATRAYLASPRFRKLLEEVAGDRGALEWAPKAFERGGRAVGTVAGSISRARILAWREGRDPLLATLSVFLGGPAVVYVAVVDDRLAVVCGAAGQVDAGQVLDGLEDGDRQASADADAEPATPGPEPLFANVLVSAEVDLAGLFDGCREAAPYWPGRGPSLRDADLATPVPLSVAVTAEHGALRAAARVSPHRVAAALLRLQSALDR